MELNLLNSDSPEWDFIVERDGYIKYIRCLLKRIEQLEQRLAELEGKK